MIRFYFNPKYKYTNRTIIDVTGDNNYKDINYVNIDSPDTVNGHLIYKLGKNETFSNIPTYLVEYTTTNNVTTYGRRWFVSGITQLNSFKYQISLLRDILSESDYWQSEEAYINAGKATNYNKYKVWGLPYTNTKVSQQKLTINGKPSFFVFYTNTRHESSNVYTEDDLEIKTSVTMQTKPYDIEVSSLDTIPSHEFIGSVGTVYHITNTDINLYTYMATDQTQPGQGSPIQWNFQNGEFDSQSTYTNDKGMNLWATDVSQVLDNVNGSLTSMTTAINNWEDGFREDTYQTQITATDITNLEPYLGKVIYDNDTQKYYTLSVLINNGSQSYTPSYSQYSTLASALSNINWPIKSGAYPSTYQVDNSTLLSVAYSYEIRAYTLTELTPQQVSCDFNFAADVDKLPKSAVRCVNIVSDSNYSDIALAQILQLMQANDGNIEDTGKIIDIQYLPFSMATNTNSDFMIDSNSLIARYINLDDVYYTTTLTTLTDINKETDTIKIVSPSRASQYLFKPYNNDGRMVFDTKITLKPYTSIIYIRPSTQGLLMYDWDDKECLVIQEDMSLTQLSSAWANYIYTNRNYQNTFNRQIQGREFERSWERRIEEANLKAEDWNSRNLSAQKARTYTGNLPIVSDIASAIGTAWQDNTYMQAVQLDLQYNEAMHQESLSMARDMFDYQLDNIKSQPTVPTNITTIDCKLLDGVYLEFYSTNPTELSAIDNYYKYNGNRIDDYGTFSDYWAWFVRGKIIKSQHYTQPEINEINIRLGAGIFTGEEFDND